jgi:hypothetical protein
VNYNLHLRIQHASGTPEPSEFDPALALIDLSLHRHNEAISDCMERGRSNVDPTLDEDSSYSDTHVPNKLFTSIAQKHGDTEDVHEWADTIVSDTNLRKRKTKLGPSESKGKRLNLMMRKKSLTLKKAIVKMMVATMVMVAMGMMEMTVMVAMGMVEEMLEHIMLRVAMLEHMALEHMVLENMGLGVAMPPKIQIMEHLIHNDVIRFCGPVNDGSHNLASSSYNYPSRCDKHLYGAWAPPPGPIPPSVMYGYGQPPPPPAYVYSHPPPDSTIWTIILWYHKFRSICFYNLTGVLLFLHHKIFVCFSYYLANFNL